VHTAREKLTLGVFLQGIAGVKNDSLFVTISDFTAFSGFCSASQGLHWH
jgi:hypothetical protein